MKKNPEITSINCSSLISEQNIKTKLRSYITKMIARHGAKKSRPKADVPILLTYITDIFGQICLYLGICLTLQCKRDDYFAQTLCLPSTACICW